MSRGIIGEGGPHNIRRVGSNEYKLNISIPDDEHGRIARECVDRDCSPGYFKVKPGTGITKNHDLAYCPYCRKKADPNEFATEEQVRYAKDMVFREAEEGIDKMLKSTFGLGPSGRKTMSSGIVSMKMEYKTKPRRHIIRPFEEEILRVVICPQCGLDHVVFGLAVWCPDCGNDIFIKHIEAEFEVIKKILGDVERRKTELGLRIEAKDLENCLEDVVSIFEAVLKSMLIRYVHEKNKSEVEIKKILDTKVRNGFQNPERAKDIIYEQIGQELFDGLDIQSIDKIITIFGKRHPITHNLGIVDRKYLERNYTQEKEGREIRVTKQEIIDIIDLSMVIFNKLHEKLWRGNES